MDWTGIDVLALLAVVLGLGIWVAGLKRRRFGGDGD